MGSFTMITERPEKRSKMVVHAEFKSYEKALGLNFGYIAHCLNMNYSKERYRSLK